MAFLRKSLLVVAGGVLAASASAQVSFAGSYSQDFDSLPRSGNAAANAWANNSTLVGWYGFRSNPRADLGDPEGVAGVRDATPNAPTGIAAVTGGGGAGGFFSVGQNSTATDRALGVIPSGSAVSGDWSLALVLRNDAALPLVGFSLSFVGEQWRVSTSTLVNTWDFDYAVLDSFSPSVLDATNTAGFVNPAGGAGDWSTPVNTGAASGLNGNLAANRVSVSVSSSSVWNPGQFLVLRWWDDNNPGDDHLMAIDDLSVTAEVIPEPSMLLVLAGAAWVVRRRRPV